MLKKEAGLYVITNTKTGMKYFGRTNNVYKRLILQHLHKLRNNNHPNNHLQNSFNKHGEHNFTFEAVEYTSNDLPIKEQQLIDSYPSDMLYNKKGKDVGIEGHCLETRQKMSDSHKGVPLTYSISGENNPNYKEEARVNIKQTFPDNPNKNTSYVLHWDCRNIKCSTNKEMLEMMADEINNY